MLPLALGTGPGAEERRSIAVVVIGGQTLSLLLTLLATPVFYTLFEDAARAPAWRAAQARARRLWNAARRATLVPGLRGLAARRARSIAADDAAADAP
jgi:HAE1 family hydrophobic/amphiphilic exporter-1